MADDGKKPGVGPEDTGVSSGEEMKKNGGKKGEEMKKKVKKEESGYTLAEFTRDLDAVVVDDEFGSGGEDLEEADGHSWKGIERDGAAAGGAHRVSCRHRRVPMGRDRRKDRILELAGRDDPSGQFCSVREALVRRGCRVRSSRPLARSSRPPVRLSRLPGVRATRS